MTFIYKNKEQNGTVEGLLIDICLEQDLIHKFEEWENLISTSINKGFPDEAYTDGILNVDYIEKHPFILFEASQGEYL